MNKSYKIIMCAALLYSSVFMAKSSIVNVEAKESYQEYYPLACSAFEVDVVNDNGNFDRKGCFDTFEDAKKVMKQNGIDAVVRHASSYSPTKIIAMNEGIAYSYPYRSGSVTLNIQQYNGVKSTYIPSYRELHYFSTDSYETNGNGKVHVNVTDFDGVVDLKNIDLIPYKFITSNASVYLGGNDITAQNESPYLTKVRQSYYKVEQNGNYKELRFVAYTGWAINENEPQTRFNTIVGPAADWMEVGKTYYSYNDIDYYTDRYCINKAGTYYNYYQFLPLRQKSSISTDFYNTFIEKIGNHTTDSVLWNQGDAFKQAQEEYGINSLMLFAQAACESAWGTSEYAKKRSNLFGWNAVDSNPDEASTFSSVAQAIQTQAAQYLREYLNTNDARFFGMHFGNKGSGINVNYASTPYYGLTLASIAYQCDKLYNNNDGNLTEYNESPIGVINAYGVSFYDSPNGSKVGSSEYGSTYQRNYVVTILNENGDWYEIQSSNYLENHQVLNTCNYPVTPYNWETNTLWIEKKYITQIGGNDIWKEPEISDSTGIVTVNVSNLRIRKGPGLSYSVVGEAVANGRYYIYASKEADGYTWYQIGKEQWIASSGNWLTFEKEESPAPEPTPIPTPTPTPTPSQPDETPIDQLEEIDAPEENRKMVASLDNVEYDESNHSVTLSGLALFRRMDALEGNVQHDLLLTDPETKKSKVVPCITENNTQVIFPGFNCQAVKYRVTLDLNVFENCNYYLGIRVKNGDTTGYYTFLLTNTDSDISYTKEDGTLVRLFADPSANYRYSLSAEKQSIDFSVINKPSAMLPKFGIQSVLFENGHLKMNAYAGIYQTDFTESTNPSYEVLLEDENGNVYSYETTLSLQQRNITRYMKCNNTYTTTFFDTDIDLTQLPEGTYRIYIDAKTTNARDIFEMYSIQQAEDKVMQDNEREYTLKTTNVRSRYILTIK